MINKFHIVDYIFLPRVWIIGNAVTIWSSVFPLTIYVSSDDDKDNDNNDNDVVRIIVVP